MCDYLNKLWWTKKDIKLFVSYLYKLFILLHSNSVSVYVLFVSCFIFLFIKRSSFEDISHAWTKALTIRDDGKLIFLVFIMRALL